MKKKSLKEINAMESEMISNANIFLEGMAEPKYLYKPINPLEDIKSFIDFYKNQGKEIKQIRIRKHQYDLALEKSGCKNSDELLSLMISRFGIDKFEIVILE